MDNAILELWLAEPSRYMRHYTMFSKYGNWMHLLKIENKLNWLFLQKKVRKNSRYFVSVFNKTIIPVTLVGYEMIIANLVLRTSLAIYHLISNVHSWNKCWLFHFSLTIMLRQNTLFYPSEIILHLPLLRHCYKAD